MKMYGGRVPLIPEAGTNGM